MEKLENTQKSENTNESFLDKIFKSNYTIYTLEFLILCLNIGIIVIAMKYCKRFGSSVFHFLFSFFLPFVYLIYKLFTDECDVISKTVLGAILGVYILLTVLLVVAIMKNKNYLSELSELSESIDLSKSINRIEYQKEIEDNNKKVKEYEKREKEKAEGIIYGTIVE